MNKTQIPKTDITISPICLGTMTFGTPVEEKDAIKLVHHSLDSGINFIDTANMYEGYNRYRGSPGGVAEKILGKALAGRRNKAVVATKVGMKVGDAPEDEFTSPAAILKQIDLSLKRLRADVVDIYYLHRPDLNTPMIEMLMTLDGLIRAGKIRHFGISNYSVEQTREMLSVADKNNLPRPVICQPGLSYLNRDALKELLPFCAKEGIVVAPYEVLQGGLLTGKYKRGAGIPKDSRKVEKSDWVWELDDALFDRIEDFESEAKRANMNMTHYAIIWALNQPAVISAIVGVKNLMQIDDAIAAVGKIETYVIQRRI